MDWGSMVYLGVSFGLFILFGLIVWRTFRRKNKERGEAAKYNMLDDD
jgi:cbb3-type cytochrome oxidase subunit 3